MRPYSIFQEQKLLLPNFGSVSKTNLIYSQTAFLQSEQLFKQGSQMESSLDKKAAAKEAIIDDIKTAAVATRSSAFKGTIAKRSLCLQVMGKVKIAFLPKPSNNMPKDERLLRHEGLLRHQALKKENLAEIRSRENFPSFFIYSQEAALTKYQPSIDRCTSFCFRRDLFDQNNTANNSSLNTICSKLSLLVGLADQEKQLLFKTSAAQMVLSFNSFEVKDLSYAYNLFQIFLINLTNKLTAFHYFDSDTLTFQRIQDSSLLKQQNYDAFTKSQNKSAIVGLLRLVRALNNSSKVTDVPLPTQLYTVIRSPHVFKKTREQFAITRHKRRILLNFRSIAALRLLLNSLVLLNLPVETQITIKHF